MCVVPKHVSEPPSSLRNLLEVPSRLTNMSVQVHLHLNFSCDELFSKHAIFRQSF